MNRVQRAFSLTELLVVMGIMGLLAALTSVSFRAIAKDAKLSSAKNTITAVLDNARGLALKHNKMVLVVFRPKRDGRNQYVEAILAEWSGQSGTALVFGDPHVVDRFVPIPGVKTRALPSGINVAAPYYGQTDPLTCGGVDLSPDLIWTTQTHLPARHPEDNEGESPGFLIGVMYAPDGTTITGNSATDSERMWVDFDQDRLQSVFDPDGGTLLIDYFNVDSTLLTPPTISFEDFSGDTSADHGGYFEQRFESNESYIQVAPFIAVFDDDELREIADPTQWDIDNNSGAFIQRLCDYTEFVTNNADRIHFNRYTGVVMK